MKKILKVIQERLIKKALCPGCTVSLKKAKELKNISTDKKIVQCKCTRLYIWDLNTNIYRRATKDEEQHFLTK